MNDRLEIALGFTASPAVERIEAGIAFVMAATVASAIWVADSLPGPDIVRWFFTAACLSLPFVYISLGVSAPDFLIGLCVCVCM